MTKAASHLVGIFTGHIVEIMVDVFLLLVTVALLKEVRVSHHLYATLMQVIQGVFQSFLEESIGHGMITRSHDGKVHLIGGGP